MTDGMDRRTLVRGGAALTAAAAATVAPTAAEAKDVLQLETLTYEKRGKVALVTINRPAQDNMMNLRTMAELPQVWNDFKADPQLEAAIITGAGDAAFCSGLDVSELLGSRPAGAATRRDEGSRAYTAKDVKCWKPVIAAINGFVCGPGLLFMLDADINIATPGATFLDAHMHVTGSVPILEPTVMARRLPQEQVSRMFLLGPHDPITAKRALEIGLISEIASRDRLLPRAFEMAAQITQADPRLVQGTVESLYKQRELGVGEAIARGLLIRQLAGYQAAPFKGRPIREMAKPGGKL